MKLPIYLDLIYHNFTIEDSHATSLKKCLLPKRKCFFPTLGFSVLLLKTDLDVHRLIPDIGRLMNADRPGHAARKKLSGIF